MNENNLDGTLTKDKITRVSSGFALLLSGMLCFSQTLPSYAQESFPAHTRHATQGQKKADARLCVLWADGYTQGIIHDRQTRFTRQAVQKALDLGANIDARDKHGETALIAAALYGNADIVQLLLERRANVNFQEERGATALMMACILGYTSIAKMLVSERAQINTKSKSGFTALTASVEMFHGTVLPKLLLDYGANVNATDKAGDTSLILAISAVDNHQQMGFRTINPGTPNETQIPDPEHPKPGTEDPSVIKLLLSYGADVNAKNKQGDTALKLAIEYRLPLVIKMLKAAGAK